MAYCKNWTGLCDYVYTPIFHVNFRNLHWETSFSRCFLILCTACPYYAWNKHDLLFSNTLGLGYVSLHWVLKFRLCRRRRHVQRRRERGGDSAGRRRERIGAVYPGAHQQQQESIGFFPMGFPGMTLGFSSFFDDPFFHRPAPGPHRSTG